MEQNTVSVKVEAEGLDQAIEKANRLVALLQEASNIISSLSNRDD